MRGTAGASRDRVLLIAALLLTPIAAAALTPVSASADEAAPDEERDLKVEREILLSTDLPLGEPHPFVDRFSFSTKRGVEYRQMFTIGNSEFSLRLHGPIVKKKPGLGLRLTGSVGGYPIEVKGYGNIKKQRITIRIDF